MRLKDLASTTSDLFNLPLSALTVEDGFNVRQDTPALAEHIRGLAESYKAGEYVPPLLVRLDNDRAVIVEGHCRFAGAKLAVAEGADILTLPCLPAPKGTSQADRTAIMLSYGAGGLQLSQFEQALGVKRLVGWGWSHVQIARRINKSHQHVANLLALLEAPEEAKAMIADGTVAATEVVKLIRQQGETAAVATLTKAAAAVKDNGGSRVTAKAIEAATPKTRPVAAPVPPVETVQAPERVQTLGDRAAANLLEVCAAVQAFLRAWDNPESEQVSETIAALRNLVGMPRSAAA